MPLLGRHVQTNSQAAKTKSLSLSVWEGSLLPWNWGRWLRVSGHFDSHLPGWRERAELNKTEAGRGWLERFDRTGLAGEHRHTHARLVSARRDEIYSYLAHPADNDTHVKQAQAAILRQDQLHIEDTVIQLYWD